MKSIRIKAALLLMLAFATIATAQSASAINHMFLVATHYCDSNAGDLILGITGLVSSTGVGAAAIILAVNPWLGLGAAAAYGL